MKNKKITAFIIFIVLLVASILLLGKDMFSPYVTFAYAQSHPGKYVQVIGKRNRTDQVETDDKGFTFTMINDEGEKMLTHHSGVKPMNFEHAEQLVVIGRYSGEKKFFLADKVLTKCPSKYQKEQN